MNQIVESNTKSAYKFSSFFPRFHKILLPQLQQDKMFKIHMILFFNMILRLNCKLCYLLITTQLTFYITIY